MAVDGAGAGAEIMVKVGSATLDKIEKSLFWAEF